MISDVKSTEKQRNNKKTNIELECLLLIIQEKFKAVLPTSVLVLGPQSIKQSLEHVEYLL